MKIKSERQRVLHRLKIAKGHLEKVISMVEKDEYCIDIIHQSQAVQSALQKADYVLLENHLSSCVVDHMRNGEIKKSIDEVMLVVKKANH